MEAIVIQLAVFAICTIISANHTSPDDLAPLSQEMVDYINSLNTSWKAEKNFEEKDATDLEGLLGVFKDDDKASRHVVIHQLKQLPESFDARENWPNCTVINIILDQGCCNSCWAFGITGVMSDRTCIQSKAKVNALLSIEELVACCKVCSTGCKGAGYRYLALEYWIKYGLVTGGLYGSKGTCTPYSIPTKRKCLVKTAKTPKCVRTCEKSYNISYYEDKHFGSTYYYLRKDVQQIQAEIYKHGPVSAMFTVYSDLFSYKTGVYQHKTGKEIGDHVIKILGWGTENGLPYWLVANTWGTRWGDKGYFQILRGNNECGIEENVVAVMASESRSKYTI